MSVSLAAWLEEERKYRLAAEGRRWFTTAACWVGLGVGLVWLGGWNGWLGWLAALIRRWKWFLNVFDWHDVPVLIVDARGVLSWWVGCLASEGEVSARAMTASNKVRDHCQ